MIGKRLFKQFNREDTVLVISGYPEEKSNGDTTHGIAWYTKKTLEAQSRKYGLKFVVLAEKGQDNKPRLVEKNKILILRIFDKKHPSLFPQILKWLWNFNKTKKVIVHSEFCADGGAKNFLLLLPFLLLIKLFGKKITFFSHNVVDNFDQIGEHLNLKKNSLKLAIFNLGIKIYNLGLGIIVDKVVVLDRALEERIKKFVIDSKIIYTPIWVENVKREINMKEARKKLGLKLNEKIILYFGFISWYKGADWVVSEFSKYIKVNTGEKIRLILAGGQAYSLKDRAYYKKYFNNIENLVAENKKISLTGFVPESLIGTYFRASDLVVLPYRGMIGASGTLNHVLKYRKPFMLSFKMEKALENREVVSALVDSGVKIEDIVFGHSEKGMERIVKTAKDLKKMERLKLVSENLAKKYSVLNCIESEYNKIYSVYEYTANNHFNFFKTFVFGKAVKGN
jgi:glycosyltransferase involved in cell wall biosynthesis